MSLKKGIVVAVHPEDHSVDLVMTNGARLIGVQVQTSNGSTRSGTVDLPDVPAKSNKWDISKRTGQDMEAVVGYIDGLPVVTGFLYPQINQMLSKDARALSARHQSDVTWNIDSQGNTQILHPSGTYIRIGETPDAAPVDGTNADGNAKIDRNVDRKVNVRIGLAGNVCVITMTPDGAVTMTMDKDFTVETKEGINLKAEKDIVMESGGSIRLKAATEIITDAPKVTNPSGDIIATGVSLINHRHKDTAPLVGGQSGPPIPTAAQS